MSIVNLLDLNPHKVSRDLKDYSMMITGESGIGKSELAIEIYGKDRTLMLAFEDSFKGIDGIYAVNIDNFSTLNAYINQLQNPQMRERFDTIIIDTLFLFDALIDKSVTDSYGVDLIKQVADWNQGYKIVDKRFLQCLKAIQKMGYTICYIAHPEEKKIKVNGKEMITIEPMVSKRVKSLLLPEIDIRLFTYRNESGERVVATRNSLHYDARCRVAEMQDNLPFDADAIKEEFAKAIDRKMENGGLVTDKAERQTSKEWKFEELMNYITNDLATKCAELDKLADANQIIVKHLGFEDDGTPRTLTNANPMMMGALETIMVELEMLLNK